MSEKNPYFGKHLFAKQELITRFRVQDFATRKNSSFNHCHNKEFRVFSWECYFIKTIEYFFPVFAYPDINTQGAGRILNGYTNPRLRLALA